jgi:hypothetical protein
MTQHRGDNGTVGHQKTSERTEVRQIVGNVSQLQASVLSLQLFDSSLHALEFSRRTGLDQVI